MKRLKQASPDSGATRIAPIGPGHSCRCGRQNLSRDDMRWFGYTLICSQCRDAINERRHRQRHPDWYPAPTAKRRGRKSGVTAATLETVKVAVVMRMRGASLSAIGERLNLSAERARQLLLIAEHRAPWLAELFAVADRERKPLQPPRLNQRVFSSLVKKWLAESGYRRCYGTCKQVKCSTEFGADTRRCKQCNAAYVRAAYARKAALNPRPSPMAPTAAEAVGR